MEVSAHLSSRRWMMYRSAISGIAVLDAQLVVRKRGK
jgi:hypothetical protein